MAAGQAEAESEDAVAFDTEPLVAYLDDEPGSDVVEAWIDRVASAELRGYISPVTKTEVLYVATRSGFDRDQVVASLDRLEDLGVRVHAATGCWQQAAVYKEVYTVPLGDAFSLATARETGATLLVGADTDFDDVEGVSITQFRHESV